MANVRFFIDFDGTITKVDVVDFILERFADRSWKEVERAWIDGKIGSRECLSRQIALVRATQSLLGRALAEIEIDPYFLPFLEAAKERGVPVAIVSDGFRPVIETVLSRALGTRAILLRDVPVYANDLRWTGDRVHAAFAEDAVCEHGCGNCKPRVMRRERSAADTVTFVGDGLSDRFAALDADLVFAKKKLLDFCRERGLEHKAYSDFREIESWLRSAAPRRAAAPIL